MSQGTQIETAESTKKSNKRPSVPSIVYAYGCKAPAEHREYIAAQFRQMNNYRNALCELERNRRKKVDALLGEMFPRFVEIDAQLKVLEAQDLELFTAIKAAAGKSRSRKIEPEKRAALRVVRAALKVLRDEKKLRRAQVFCTAEKRVLAAAEKAVEASVASTPARHTAEDQVAEATRVLRVAMREHGGDRFAEQQLQIDDDQEILTKLTREAYSRPKRGKHPKGVTDEQRARFVPIPRPSGSPLYWGNYSTVEHDCESMREGAPPKFMPWRKARAYCRVGVQLQKGDTIANMLAGTSYLLRITVDPEDETRATCHFRVDSTTAGKPVWTTVDVNLHRKLSDLPPDTQVKWAYLYREEVTNPRIAADSTKPAAARGAHAWRLLLTLSAKGGFPKPDVSADGKVGINLGWRNVSDGLRVASWVGSDNERNTLVLPTRMLSRWTKADELRSTADLYFNMGRDVLTAWLRQEPVPEGLAEHLAYLTTRIARLSYDAPPGKARDWARQREVFQREKDAWMELRDTWQYVTPTPWFLKQVETLHLWKSPARLAELVVDWRTDAPVWDREIQELVPTKRRWAGDAILYDAFDAWRKRYKHLSDWFHHQLLKAVRHRDDVYRNFAADVRRKYGQIVLGDIDYRKLQEKAEFAGEEQAGARAQMRCAAVGRLHQILTVCGAKTVLTDPQWITKRCCVCGTVSEFDAAKEITRTCPNCKDVRQHDLNAAQNLRDAEVTYLKTKLRDKPVTVASDETVAESPESLADEAE